MSGLPLTSALIVLFLLAFPRAVSAHCPLCAAGVVGGLTLTRWLGIDDVYSGIWLGGLVGSLSFWFGGSLKRKFVPYQEYLVFLFLFLLTTVPFLYVGLGNPHAPRLFGVNRLFFGMVVGGVVFLAATFLDRVLRRLNKGHVLFPYQGVILTLGSLVVSAVILYLFLR